MKVFVVGIGVNGEDSLTIEAKEAISEAELLIGAERMTKPFSDSGKIIENACIAQDIADILEKSNFETAAVLMSGDCGFFSGAKKLLPLLECHEITIISGISSMAYFCGKIGISYENMRFISLHGRHGNIAINTLFSEKCFYLLGGEMTAADVCQRLCDYGLSDVTVYVGENLGYENEQVVSFKVSEFRDDLTSKLSVLVTENPDFMRFIPCSISDESFIRGSVPMTKSIVRGNIVASLEIGKNDICWDIGCGTGAISIEMAFRCPDGMVYAFDKNSEAIELTVRNSRRFGCDNITAIDGICPNILGNFNAPNKVFIGGSSGNMNEIFKCVYNKNPYADIAVSAVSLETLTLAQEAFEKFGGEYSIVQIAVTETRKICNHTMLSAQNPVFIIRGKLQ